MFSCKLSNTKTLVQSSTFCGSRLFGVRPSTFSRSSTGILLGRIGSNILEYMYTCVHKWISFARGLYSWSTERKREEFERDLLLLLCARRMVAMGFNRPTTVTASGHPPTWFWWYLWDRDCLLLLLSSSAVNCQRARKTALKYIGGAIACLRWERPLGFAMKCRSLLD